MALFKCKMCGGSLEIAAGTTVIECEYCGTQQTLPKLDDDKRANLYDRANHFRRNNEFDKAMGIYEQILNEDNTDAEAYWSLVLCRYGIEYVEDPSTKKRIPTVNRAQFTSIFDDEDYKSALRNADTTQRSVYEAEAKAVNEIQKGILAISQKEEPFDVFICYKETDNNGRRTPDSVLAQELYFGLKNEGFKVFFARITLEDKLGSAYEPYIFAALNSAKVMVVLGTKPEFFSAVWVKNEWSRYLALIKQGQKKMLIPAYKDMDPYDLPEEFSHLQAQDMSKLGFMQDLIRGIKKIVKAEEPKQTVVKETVVKETVATTGASNTAPLLKRAFMFLEDGDWNNANEYCEKVLDMDPENAQAYLGKLMAECRVRKQEGLKDCAEPFDNRNNYQKAIRFANATLRAELKGYIEHIKTRNENARLEGIYTQAKNAMKSAKTEQDFKEARKLFASIDTYKDSASLRDVCYEKAETARKDACYSKAKGYMASKTLESNAKAISAFAAIPGWRDADELRERCKKEREALEQQEKERQAAKRRQEELARQQRERLAEEQRLEEERQKKRKKKRKVIIGLIIALAIIALLVGMFIFYKNITKDTAFTIGAIAAAIIATIICICVWISGEGAGAGCGTWFVSYLIAGIILVLISWGIWSLVHMNDPPIIINGEEVDADVLQSITLNIDETDVSVGDTISLSFTPNPKHPENALVAAGQQESYDPKCIEYYVRINGEVINLGTRKETTKYTIPNTGTFIFWARYCAHDGCTGKYDIVSPEVTIIVN